MLDGVCAPNSTISAKIGSPLKNSEPASVVGAFLRRGVRSRWRRSRQNLVVEFDVAVHLHEVKRKVDVLVVDDRPAGAAVAGVVGRALGLDELGQVGHRPQTLLILQAHNGRENPAALNGAHDGLVGERADVLVPRVDLDKDAFLDHGGVEVDDFLELFVVLQVDGAILVEHGRAAALEHDENGIHRARLTGEHRAAGLGLHVAADLDEALPRDVLQVGGGVAGGPRGNRCR